LIESVAGTFTHAPSVSDVVGAWSGVRPLLRQEGKKPSEISRRDEIRVGPGPIVAIAGGKLTTYRKMAERVVAAVDEVLGGRATAPPGVSAELALSGGSAVEQAAARSAAPRSGDAILDDRLWATYGTAAAQILERIAAGRGATERVGGLGELTTAELEHTIEAEMALSLDDVLRRRSRVGMFHIERACEAAPAVAKAMAERLGWNGARVAAEVDRFNAGRAADLAAVRAASR
jgi:glycerol-3-phosphate dehydrogenase